MRQDGCELIARIIFIKLNSRTLESSIQDRRLPLQPRHRLCHCASTNSVHHHKTTKTACRGRRRGSRQTRLLPRLNPRRRWRARRPRVAKAGPAGRGGGRSKASKTKALIDEFVLAMTRASCHGYCRQCSAFKSARKSAGGTAPPAAQIQPLYRHVLP